MIIENPNLNIMRFSGSKYDTLLRHFEGREKDLLYMRSDNKNEMKLETETKTINYFAGYFEDISPKNLKRENKIL